VALEEGGWSYLITPVGHTANYDDEMSLST